MKNVKRTKTLIISLTSFIIVGLSNLAFASDDSTLSADVGFVNTSTLPEGTSHISPVRLQALRQTSTQLGANGALAWRSLQINHSLDGEARRLDRVFDFNQLLLQHDVLPPVLTEADNSIAADGGTALRISSKVYKIVSNARFVTAPPTWRTYLYMNYPKPDMPDRTLLPNTQAEAKVWNAYFQQGWKEGLLQANEIFSTNLSRLKRDYTGMILYRKLLAQHMVSAPFVAKSNLGVTGNANELQINDQVLRITAESELQTNPDKWKAVISK